MAGGIAAVLALTAPEPARATPLISEVFYDAVGSDDGHSFVELAGEPDASVDGLVLEGVNGAGGGVITTIELSGAISVNGLFVVADLDAGARPRCRVRTCTRTFRHPARRQRSITTVQLRVLLTSA